MNDAHNILHAFTCPEWVIIIFFFFRGTVWIICKACNLKVPLKTTCWKLQRYSGCFRGKGWSLKMRRLSEHREQLYRSAVVCTVMLRADLGSASAPWRHRWSFASFRAGLCRPSQHTAVSRRILKAEAEQVILLLGAGWCCSLLGTLESWSCQLKEEHGSQGKGKDDVPGVCFSRI